MVAKVLKETGRELSPENLFIAGIWNLWGAPPINLGTLCFTSWLHAAFCRTFYINGKEPGDLGLSRLKLCPWKGESSCIHSRGAFNISILDIDIGQCG